ncbi:uncharacterized protein KY384_005465 [Bacidia gigantensis]|uniref:uncharacterized protein n=1 Tax=Bacidia gigantensis TaxID=2732470 RepID=UPI001D037036|nr:uncharacterized protein KY384_005465 [Bacidia gigantensis]KAG8529983.1 hypothetical protein KY384_005465 [Bacidia gigantensis]
MVGKKSTKALLRDEGLERTDNNMDLTNWPQVGMINQKNYYTEYLKRDDQILPLRLILEERRSRMIRMAKEKDRSLFRGADSEIPDQDVDMDDEGIEEGPEALTGQEAVGSKVIVVHPGSQNLRIGLASDALPKSIPMVIARRWKSTETEEDSDKRCPKRRRLNSDEEPRPEHLFGEDFSSQYGQMCTDLKVRMRANKRRVLPNSKDMIVTFNKRAQMETIPMHNDPMQIDWTEIRPKDAPGHICGKEALRIPEKSNPRYKLFWPLRHGWLNEEDYESKRDLFNDIAVIIEEAIKSQLGLHRKRDWIQYGCVFVLPDLYERPYIVQVLDLLLRDLGFGKVSFIQESLAATFGAGYIASCVVDVGAQKTSICCVEEGMCIENSRLNLKYGGFDVTETFVRMMLHDHFPYQEINLRRRHDFLLAEELKAKFCSLNEQDVSPQLYDFHLRASDQDTRKYQFKTYDEVLLAPQGYFEPTIFDNSDKLVGRRKLVGASRDVYEGGYNEPVSAAQAELIGQIAPLAPTNGEFNGEPTNGASTTAAEKKPLHLLVKGNGPDRASASAAGTPAPEDEDTPAPPGDEKEGEKENANAPRDDVLPIMPLDQAILASINHGARGDERKTREFLGQIMVIGGGAQVPGFYSFLEQRLKELRPGWAKDILIGIPPREMDPQGVIWKGGSVFGKLHSSADSWIGRMEYDRLGARLLMLPGSAHCDECTPGALSPRPSTLIFSSLPFIATFLLVAVFVAQKLFPFLSGEGSVPKGSNSNRPASVTRPAVKQISAWIFSSTIASATVLAELILCEISNTIDPAARGLAIHLAISLLLFFLVVAIPFLEIHTVISTAGYQFTGGSSSSFRLAWVIQISSFAVWILAFWKSGEYLIGKGKEIGPAQQSDVVEASLERIGVIGISFMALLSGFASVSSPWQSFFSRSKPVSEASVARKAAGIEATQDMLAAKRARLMALERKISESPTKSFFEKAIGSIRGDPDRNEKQALQLEVSGLETMALSLSTSHLNLQTRLNLQNRSRTAKGRLALTLAYCFSIFCVYRIVTTSLTFIRRSLSSHKYTSEAFTTSDPVDNILALLAKHYDSHLDQAAWARQISFLLSGIILFASFSSVMQTFHLFARFLPSLLKTIQANLALVVAQVCATYVISAALMLRVMMPSAVVGEGLKTLGGGKDNMSWVDGWFERWFLAGVLVTGIGIWVGRTMGTNDDWDDDFDDAGGLEMGKMS